MDSHSVSVYNNDMNLKKNEVLPVKNMETPWTSDGMAEIPLSEYPRPQMVREQWICLNGMWNYVLTGQRILPHQFYGDYEFPYDGEIRVPFSPEALLSGVNRQLQPDETLWYSRDILLPEDYFHAESCRLLLHFGAVDQHCTVYINGKHAGFHRGGYLPFTVDVSDFMADDRTLRILIAVKDLSDTSYHAKGKQMLKNSGMYYTAQSGIWQTVWLECVPKSHISSIRITPDFDTDSVKIRIQTTDTLKNQIICKIYEPGLTDADGIASQCQGIPVTEAILLSGKESCCQIPKEFCKPWTPERPFLYPVSLHYGKDVVYTYFALRKCDIQKDKNGYPRFYLNNQPYFQTGVLDQGYWPDGLYTAPSDDALIYDIRSMKDLGFNMLRKHGKIECDRWYFHCDRMGMLVWQDMVNGGSAYKSWFVTYLATLFQYIPVSVSDKNRKLLSRMDYEGRQEFIDEVRQSVKALYNHPSIVTWTLFNEGWGQFSTKKLTEMLKRLDPSRLIDSASGWFDQGCGDIKSHHYYFFRLRVPKDPRVVALTEFGGYSWRVPGHSMCKKVYGYKVFKNRDELSLGYCDLMENTICPSVAEGVSAIIYTQLSDIEEEVNGLLTYDRKETKMHPLLVRKWNAHIKNCL